MRTLAAAMLSFALMGCSPPAAPPSEGPPPAAPEAPAADYGPYSSSWDAAEFSRFSHTLNAPAPGVHQLTLAATTNAPGGETVAVYPLGEGGEPATARIMFVIATTAGGTQTADLNIPAEGLPVVVVVENASGRPFAGQYTLSLAPLP